MRGCLRLLLERVPSRGRRQDDGEVHSARHGLRCHLPNGVRLYGPGQHLLSGRLSPVHRGMRGVRPRMRAACESPLPGLYAGLPTLCRRMSANRRHRCVTCRTRRTDASGGSPYGASTLRGSDGSPALCDHRGMRYFASISLRHRLDPLRPPRRWIGKVLRFVGQLVPAELHTGLSPQSKRVEAGRCQQCPRPIAQEKLHQQRESPERRVLPTPVLVRKQPPFAGVYRDDRADDDRHQ